MSDRDSAIRILNDAMRSWETIGILRTHTELLGVLRALCRQRVMIAESSTPPLVRSIIHDTAMQSYGFDVANLPDAWSGSPSANWLCKLAADVKAQALLRRPFTLQSHRYSVHLRNPGDFPASVTAYPTPGSRTYHTKLADVVAAAAMTWMGARSDAPCQATARAYLVHQLLRWLGPGSLLLDAAWNIYETLPIWLFDSRWERHSDLARTAFDPSMLSVFIEALAAFVHTRGTAVTDPLKRLQEIYLTYAAPSKVRICIPHVRNALNAFTGWSTRCHKYIQQLRCSTK